VIVVIGVYFNKKSDLEDYLQTKTQDTQIHTKMVLLQLNHIATIFYDEKINTPAVQEIMYEASHTQDAQKLANLREKLYKMLQPAYAYFKQNGVRQLHFHLPKAISFLRFHKPDKFGDSLWDIRESIVYVNQNKTPISCYEEGRIFNGFRNVYPIFKGNQFVGTVEISYSFLALQKDLLAIDSTSYLFLVSKKEADEKLFKSEYFHYEESEFRDFLCDKATLQDVMEFRLEKLHAINRLIASDVEKKLQKGEAFSLEFSNKNIYNGKRIVLTFIPVKNIDSKTVAYIIHYQFDKFLELLIYKIGILFIISTLIVLLISMMLMMYLIYYKKKQDLIQMQATHDALTNIYNRYGINDILKQKIGEFERYGKSFSLIFFDIDFFKKINDTYGHDMGDFVLQNIVKMVNTQIRNSDAFGRWGGEEFIIILSETTSKHAITVAEKLRKTVEKETFGLQEAVTCSFGVASIQRGDTITSLLKRADEYLYEAKESGRNRVVCHDN
jgi:diguanylate cyclase (GGDEF)-like protein